MKHELVQSITVFLTVLKKAGLIKKYLTTESENVLVDTFQYETLFVSF